MKEKKEEKTGWLGGLGIGAVGLMGLVRLGDWCNDYYTQREQAEIRRNEWQIKYNPPALDPRTNSDGAPGVVGSSAGNTALNPRDPYLKDLYEQLGVPSREFFSSQQQPKNVTGPEVPAKQETATTTTTPTAELETPTSTQIKRVSGE